VKKVRWTLFVEMGIHWAAATALAIATAFFLWGVEAWDDQFCLACNNEYKVEKNSPVGIYDCSEDEVVDVKARFTTILQIYFAVFIINWVIYTAILLAGIFKSEKLARVVESIGCCNCCYGLAALIILHVYRFQPSGRYCSLDFLTTD
jgi:hypothetical protein